MSTASPVLTSGFHREHRVQAWGVFWLGMASLVGFGQSFPKAVPVEAATAAAITPAAGPLFDVHRYNIVGNTVLTSAQINDLLRDTTGTRASLSQIRRTLVQLQEAYRDRGYKKAAILLPQQSLTNGVITVQVSEGPDSSRASAQDGASATLGTIAAPTYDIRHFEVRGNTVLQAEELDSIIGPLAGSSLTLEQIQKVLSTLQEEYRRRGHLQTTVRLPQQMLTDGTVTVQVDNESAPPLTVASFANMTVPQNVTIPPPARVFEVRRYEVLGNTLLSSNVLVRIFTNATGTNVTLPQVQKALGDLQLAYRERGFASVGVSLPQQQLTNAIVKVLVTEGSLVDIRVSGNHYFSSNNITRALPSARTNTLLNSRVFQRELDIANQNRDRQIYPTLGPGPEPGTSSLLLRVKDRLPLHGRIEVNNQSTPGTPEWRINSSLSYANLWQREHQLGISYGFSPEQFKSGGSGSDFLLNRPLIANYGGYYRLPFGQAQSVEEQIAGSPGRFGYDEATHQFRLPPAGARPDLTFFASGSSSDTGVKYGPTKLISQTPLLTITSVDSGQNTTINESAGGRVNIPFIVDDHRRWNLSAGPDAKREFLESFNTNNFIITTVITNAQGSQTIESQVASSQPSRHNEAIYLPLSVGADYYASDSGGTFSGSLGIQGNVLGDSDEFAASAYSKKAGADYIKGTLSLTRDQTVFRDWSLLLRGSAQAATGALISNEQFAMGGLNSVRGYSEGESYGDAGWFGSVELRTPYLATQFPIGARSVPAWLRGSAFFDAGQRYFLESFAGDAVFRTLMGAGLGASANINNHFDMRIAVGWPLRDSQNGSAYDPHAYFSVGGQF